MDVSCYCFSVTSNTDLYLSKQVNYILTKSTEIQCEKKFKLVKPMDYHIANAMMVWKHKYTYYTSDPFIGNE